MHELTTKSRLFTGFSGDHGQDFFIISVGYDDFHVVKPVTAMRQQSCHTIHVVLHGNGWLHLGTERFRVTQHEMFYVPPETNVMYYPDTDAVWDYTWFAFDGTLAARYAQSLGLSGAQPVTACRDYPQTFFQLQRLLHRLDTENNLGYFDALSTFYKVLDINGAPSPNTTQSLVERALVYIDTHYYHADMRIEDLCRDLHVSHSYLCKIFKQTHGITAKQHLVQVRLHAATRLLQSTNMTGKEIAHAVGFQDELHFAKTFKKHCQMTTKQYRLC